jgi:hypothetical protein
MSVIWMSAILQSDIHLGVILLSVILQSVLGVILLSVIQCSVKFQHAILVSGIL